MLNKLTPPYLGVAYYPEVFGEDFFEQDIERMHEAGINCVRIAEFAWSTMERSEGDFDFSLFHKILDRFYQENIAVVLCTPSATPPKWLTDQYPETLVVSASGEAAEFGARCHVCKSSVTMRQKNRIIVEKMCQAFTKHPAVVGWQIDNEIYPYGDGCYCPHCRKRFQHYIANKYQTIENLNKKWMRSRWSLDYSSFDDIIAPVKGKWNHPSLEVEWLKFQSDLIIEYVKEQADVIRSYFDVPIGTDMMPMLGADYYGIMEHLDLVQFNHYEQESWGLGVPSFWYDFLRPIKDRPFWVTETQFGWHGGTVVFSAYRNVGNCYANTWQPLIKGGEANMYWHFRAHACGHELHYGSVITTQGRFNYPVAELQQASQEFDRCADMINHTRIHAEIALVMSTTAWRNFEYVPHLQRFVGETPYVGAKDSYMLTLKDNYHAPLLHHNVDIIDTPHALDGYKVLLTPLLTHATEHGFKERVLEWVENGGKWIAGPLTDTLTDYASKYLKSPTSFLESVAGVTLKYQLPGDTDQIGAEWTDGGAIKVSKFLEGYELNGAKSLAKFTDHCLNGLSVITEKSYGKGSIIVLGAVIDADALLKLIGIAPILQASANVELTKRSGDTDYIIANELDGKEGSVELDGTYAEMLTGETLRGNVAVKPYQVLILQKVS